MTIPVVTFNYTHTFEKLYTPPTETIKIRHIHGNTNDKIIFGVNPDDNDELRYIDTSFISFKKYYQRVLYHTDIEYLDDYPNISDSNVRFARTGGGNVLNVIGHSLDVTDKDTITQLFDVSTRVNIYYHEQSVIGQYVNNLINIYGKTEFDNLRISKKLRFLPLE